MLRGLKQFNLPEIEAQVLKFWEDNKVFEKSLGLRKPSFVKAMEGEKRSVFRFFDGPPTANGHPHIGHAETRAFKDIILRYKTMRGFYVPRKAGWDTHGLPVELEIEKQLGLKNKQDIEKFGIAEFNEKAKESVWKYKNEWEEFTKAIGFWIDVENPYITYSNNFVETLWWVMSQVAKRKLIKKAHRIVPWCPRCQTPLSSHELAQAYKIVKDPAVWVKFRLKSGSPSTSSGQTSEFLLVWTTTPWTLPSNVAVAVNPKLIYTKYKIGDEFIWSYSVPPTVNNVSPEVVEQILGTKMVGWGYEALYDLNISKFSAEGGSSFGGKDLNGSGIANKNLKKFYRVLAGDFVGGEDGTGMVHIAPAFGEDDAQLIKKEWNLKPEEVPFTIDDAGKVLAGLPGAGKFIKSADEDIMVDLANRGLLYFRDTAEHSYPFCWRCSTPLIYFARVSWFIEMSKLRDDLLESNKKINWVPAHLKDGRFGEWLKDIKDWSISRERYWGTPLPFWECGQCDHLKVVSGLPDLDKLAYSNNKFFIARHGEADHNLSGIIAAGKETLKNRSELTVEGKAQVKASAKKIKKEKIALIIASPYYRTKQTAEIIAKELKIKEIIYDARIGEIDCGIFNGKQVQEHKDFYNGSPLSEFAKAPPEGESLFDVRKRMMQFILEINKKHKDKNILIISHGDPLWILEGALKNIPIQQFMELDYIQPGQARQLEFHNFPYNRSGEVDVHRPYIDEVILKCEKCKSAMKRVKEVADVWFDSGAMPWAQWHYPFENKKLVDSGAVYPADYITEGIDQTRGWFYTLLAVATLLKRGVPYFNVLSLGHVLDKGGTKMSKSKGNVVEPMAMIKKYGADVLRWYFYTVNPAGEPKKFDENDLLKTFRRFFAIVYNSFVFLETYGNFANIRIKHEYTKNILDRWILIRLNQLTGEVTRDLDAYAMDEAARKIEVFVDDLSRWYIRRSRRRFQRPESQEDLEQASITLREVLLTLSKIIAPFTPFFAEGLYLSLCYKGKWIPASAGMTKECESVHLCDWPTFDKKMKDEDLLMGMEEVRRLATLGLAERAEAGIKVRQPLGRLKVKGERLKVGNLEGLINILKDEVNVKEIVWDNKIAKEVELDVEITQELREEGLIRELVRMIQDLRQSASYKPQDMVILNVELSDELRMLFEKNMSLIKKEAHLELIEFKRSDKVDVGIDTEMDGVKIWLGVRK